MYRILSIILILICISAGCISGDTDQAAGPEQSVQTGYQKPAEAVYLITPGEGVPAYAAGIVFKEIIGADTPEIYSNYSIGYITIPKGSGTPPHRLLKSPEYIFVTAGEAKLQCDNTSVNLKAGESVIIPKEALQSVKSSGDEELQYISMMSPDYSKASEVLGEELSLLNMTTDLIPVVIENPADGIEWDIGSDMVIYSLANPVLMPDMKIPFEYSVAYAELLPGGMAEDNYLKGSSELICVIEGEIEVYAPGGVPVRVTAGEAAYIPANQVKGYRNVAGESSKMLSFVDPAWTPEMSISA